MTSNIISLSQFRNFIDVTRSWPSDVPEHNGNPPYNTVNPYSNTSANSTKVYLTNANSNKMGLGIILKVMAGDKVNIYGKSYHKRPPGQGYKDVVSPLTVLDILNAFSGTVMITAKGVSSGDISSRPGFPNSVAGLVGNQPGQSKNQPKASIDWILFDEQFGYAGGGFDMVGAENTSNGTFKEHNLNTIPMITVPKNGYIYVYCANESQYDVFFDNLQVIHTRGPVLEETHYYPFGLTMAGISSKAVSFGLPENKKKYNGIEKENALAIAIYDAQFRELDAQVGRWWQIDPKTENMEMWSPYTSNYNNPITYSDPLGDEGRGCCLDGVINWVFQLADKLTTSKQRNNANAAVNGTSNALKQWGANAKANWNAGNDPIHQAVANPIGLVVGIGPLRGSSLSTFARMETGAALTEKFLVKEGAKEFSIPVKVIKGSDPTKTAVIGQGMDKVKQVATQIENSVTFEPSASTLKEWDKLLVDAGGKQLSDDVVRSTAIFKENQAWITSVKKAGYNIADAGGGTTSTFYNMEKQAVYGNK